MKNEPSLFTCTATREHDGFVEEFTIDLNSILMMSKRTGDLGYYMHVTTGCLSITPGIGSQIHAAWLAFRGKFIPGQTN